MIGGGVIGLSIARALTKRGVSVRVLDAGEPGQEASTAAAGMLAPQYEAAGGEAALLQLCLKSSELHLRTMGKNPTAGHKVKVSLRVPHSAGR
ncbi:MAG: FAD-binding oxidoreductase [Deltaproteobacteria bacterium]|nr:FAD-binding oxidoreductase [Deltaproteobacteria bacterium]